VWWGRRLGRVRGAWLLHNEGQSLLESTLFCWCGRLWLHWLGLFERDAVNVSDLLRLVRDEVFLQQRRRGIEQLRHRAALQSAWIVRDKEEESDRKAEEEGRDGPIKTCLRASKTAAGLLELWEPRKQILIFGPTKAR
jgi:hypothetical protein